MLGLAGEWEDNLDKTTELEALKEEVKDLRSELYEQDHRLFVVAKRFFIDRKKLHKGDKTRDAITKSLLYALLFSPATIAIAGGTLGLASLGVLIWQNYLISEQNSNFRAEIVKRDNQWELERRTTLLRLLYEEVPDCPKLNTVDMDSWIPRDLRSPVLAKTASCRPDYFRVRKQAVSEWIELERQNKARRERIDLRRLDFRAVDVVEQNWEGVDFSGSYFENVTVVGSSLNGTIFDGAEIVKGTFSSPVAPKVSFAHATLVDVAFESFVTLSVPAEFTEPRSRRDVVPTITYADFLEASLEGVSFSNIDMSEADFHEATMRNVVFSNVDLSTVILEKNRLFNVSFVDVVGLDEHKFMYSCGNAQTIEGLRALMPDISIDLCEN